jgi:hypothetical protein
VVSRKEDDAIARVFEAGMVTINKVSNVEIGIKVKGFVITRVKKFVDMIFTFP